MTRKQKEIDPQTLEILSSIRQIIDDEEGEDKPVAKSAAKQKPVTKAKPVKKAKPAAKKPVTKKPKPKQSATKKPEDILVLTELAPEDTSEKAIKEDPKVIQMPTPVEEGHEGLAEVEPEVASDIIEDLDLDNALEELVRDMLKEKLQDYLDKHLSEMIKKVAAEELAKMRKKD